MPKMGKWLRLLAITAALTGSVLAGGGTTASAATAPVDLNGSWTDTTGAKPKISESGGSVVIDMSYAGRPSAVGVVNSATTILITFPDAGTFLGTRSGSEIRWSNGATWTKVFTGGTVFNLNGEWHDINRNTAGISNSGGYLVVRRPGRPTAFGYVSGTSTIVVTFPDDATFSATLDTATFTIRWSNNTVWFPSV